MRAAGSGGIEKPGGSLFDPPGLMGGLAKGQDEGMAACTGPIKGVLALVRTPLLSV